MIRYEFLANHGEIIYAFQHIRVHEPLQGGGSSYRKSANLNGELLEASRKIVGALNYHGVGMVEFKMNMQSGKWIFIELNARFWGSLPLAIASGADFPYYLFLLLVKGIKEIPDRHKRNIYCRNLSRDLTWLIINLRADHSDRTLSTKPLSKVFCELFNFLLFRERNDTLVMDDIKPGIAEISDIVSDYYADYNEKAMVTIFLTVQQHHIFGRSARLTYLGYAAPIRLSKSAALLNGYSPVVLVL